MDRQIKSPDRALRRWLNIGSMRFRFVFVMLVASAAPLAAQVPREIETFLAAARGQVGKTLTYDSAYTSLIYPGGDVPLERGVCSDVIVRAFRGVGLDLQKEIHLDMQRAFSAYPKNWGLSKPDPSIDHRRVLNLMAFLKHRGKSLPVTQHAPDYQPGDLVTCLVPKNLPHIMIVSDQVSALDPQRRLVIHNIGQGAQIEDRLFEFELTGHYRWW